MLLLISPINREEALESIKGGADIVDVKNPKEGSLGANFPWVIKEIRELTPEDKLVSATLGDVPYKPGTVSLAAMGAHVSGADYIKVGLYGTKDHDEAVEVMEGVVKTVKEISEETEFIKYSDEMNDDEVLKNIQDFINQSLYGKKIGEI